MAAVLIELLGIPLGIFSALRQYTFWDTALTTTALIIWGIPVFVLGLFVQWFFSLKLQQWFGIDIFPLTGAGDNVLWVIPASWDSFMTLVLPAVTLGLIGVAYISYMQRASMLEVIRSDYIRTARAKGLSERQVVRKHAFKNAIIPVMTIAGIDLGALMAGAILTETVFSRPGIGLDDLPGHRRPRPPGRRGRSALRDLHLRVRQPVRRPRLRLGRSAHPAGEAELLGRARHQRQPSSRRTSRSVRVSERDIVEESPSRAGVRWVSGQIRGGASSAITSPSSAWVSSSSSSPWA